MKMTVEIDGVVVGQSEGLCMAAAARKAAADFGLRARVVVDFVRGKNTGDIMVALHDFGYNVASYGLMRPRSANWLTQRMIDEGYDCNLRVTGDTERK